MLFLSGCLFATYMSFVDKVEPAVVQYDAAVSERDALASQLAGISQVSQDRASAELSLQKADEELEWLFRQLPKDPDMEALLGMVAEAAHGSGVELQNYKVEEEAKTGVELGAPGVPLGLGAATVQPPAAPATNPAGASASPAPGAVLNSAQPPAADDLVRLYALQNTIKVDVTGTFPGITTFLDKVLSLPRIVQVGDLELTAPEFDKITPGRSPQLSAAIRFKTYSQRPEIGAAPVPQAPPVQLAPAPSGAGVPPEQLSSGEGGAL